MKCVMKGAVLMAVLVVVLTAAKDASDCIPARESADIIEIPESEREKSIYNRTIEGSPLPEASYVVPMKNFEGVRAVVTANNETYPVCFPIMEHCRLNDSKWWQVLLDVKRNTDATFNVSLTVQKCLLAITVAPNGAPESVKLQNMELFGLGASKWKRKYPSSSGCKVETVAQFPDSITIRELCPAGTEEGSNAWWIVLVVVGVLVVFGVLVAVGVVIRKQMR